MVFSLKAWIDALDCAERRTKGIILGTPKHGTLLLADQNDVNNFVNSCGKAGADMEQVCT